MTAKVKTTYGLRNPPDSGRDPLNPSVIPPDAADMAAWCMKIYERVKRIEAENAQLKADWRADHEALIQLQADRADYKRRLSIVERLEDVTQPVEMAKIRQTVDGLENWKRATRGLVWAALLGLAGTLAGGLYQAASIQITCTQVREQMAELDSGMKAQATTVQQARELVIDRTTTNRENIRSLTEKLEGMISRIDKVEDVVSRRRR